MLHSRVGQPVPITRARRRLRWVRTSGYTNERGPNYRFDRVRISHPTSREAKGREAKLLASNRSGLVLAAPERPLFACRNRRSCQVKLSIGSPDT